MDLDEAITITKINTQVGPIYLLIGWQSKSFETYIYHADSVWKGKFTSNRLAGFSKNLQITEHEYFINLRRCLSQQRDDYRYELKSGFFYWKRILNGSIIIEGFLPVESETSPGIARPDLVEVLLALNRYSNEKLIMVKRKLESIKTEYTKCLKDTQEFLNLKNNMEKALSNKFLNLLNLKKNEILMFDTNICSNVKNDSILCNSNIEEVNKF